MSPSSSNSGGPKAVTRGRATGMATRKAMAPNTPPIAEALRLAPSARPALPMRAKGKPSCTVAASAALADLLSAVRTPDLSGPLVAGGSVIVRGMLAAPPSLRAELVPLGNDHVIPVSDGLVGAAVLVLRHASCEVDEGLFRTIQAEVARVTTPGA